MLPNEQDGCRHPVRGGHWVAFANFLRDGCIKDITNNAAERGRPVDLGQRTGMFICHEDACRPAVVLMSLIQTCREIGVDAAAYLRDVLVRISEPGSDRKLAELRPVGWKNAANAAERGRRSRTAILAAVRSRTCS